MLGTMKRLLPRFLLASASMNLVPACLAQESSPAPPPSITEQKNEDPAYRGLDANLYIQTSAEYRACCFQAFHWAKRLVNEKLVSRIAASQRPLRTFPTAAGENSPPMKPPAVILDLDETVFDNQAFQTKQIREGWAYSQEYWSKFELDGGKEVVAIPGAIEFIRHLKSLGVQPIYITNRNARANKSTMEILRRMGIEVPEKWLLAADAETKSNKDSRRAKVREHFDVLLLVGDNLRDFEDFFKYDGSSGEGKGIDDRKQVVDSNRQRFGVEWVILPNPAYGEWNKPLGKGPQDADLLQPRLP
jgi:acid phosphatase